MTPIHEYALLGGRNRASIGRLLGSVAAVVSGGLTFLLLTADDLAKKYGWNHNVPPVILSLAGAGLVYTALYWLFDRQVWKLPGVRRILQVPNLAGRWHCDGQTLNEDKSVRFNWQGEVTIIQSWDRIRVRLQTSQSASNSISAALVYDESGPILMYNYENEPQIEERELTRHRGFVEFTFNPNLRAARGEYFNGQGRFTFGVMHLRRL